MAEDRPIQFSLRIPAEVHNWLSAASGFGSINAYLLSIIQEKMAAEPLLRCEKHPSTVVTVRLSKESIQDLASVITSNLQSAAR